MSETDVKLIIEALDSLWGATENLHAICREMIDPKDLRVLEASAAIDRAHTAIMELQQTHL